MSPDNTIRPCVENKNFLVFVLITCPLLSETGSFQLKRENIKKWAPTTQGLKLVIFGNFWSLDQSWICARSEPYYKACTRPFCSNSFDRASPGVCKKRIWRICFSFFFCLSLSLLLLFYFSLSLNQVTHSQTALHIKRHTFPCTQGKITHTCRHKPIHTHTLATSTRDKNAVQTWYPRK